MNFLRERAARAFTCSNPTANPPRQHPPRASISTAERIMLQIDMTLELSARMTRCR